MITGIATGVFQSILKYFTNFLYAMLTPLVNIIWETIPDLDSYLDLFYNFTNYITKFVVYAIDLSMITKPVWILVITSIVYRITFSYVAYGVKLVVNWYHYLVP